MLTGGNGLAIQLPYGVKLQLYQTLYGYIPLLVSFFLTLRFLLHEDESASHHLDLLAIMMVVALGSKIVLTTATVPYVLITTRARLRKVGGIMAKPGEHLN